MTAPGPPAQQNGGPRGFQDTGQAPIPAQHYPPLPHQRSPQEAFAAEAAVRELATRTRTSRRRRWIIGSVVAVIVLIVIGLVNWPAPIPGVESTPPPPAAPAAGRTAEQAFIADINDTPGLTSTVPDSELIGIGRSICDGIPTPGMSRELLLSTLGTSKWGPEVSRVVVAAAETNLCPGAQYGGGSPAAAAAGQPAAAAPAPAAVPQQKFSGKGNDVVDLAAPLDSGVVQFDCAKCSRNVILKSEGDLLVNTIGKYTGTRWVTQETSRFEIQATGSWTLTVGGFDLARTAGAQAPVSGHGDQVLLFPSSPDKVRLTHQGRRNFVVQVIGANSSFPDLLVNDIGRWEGTVAFPDAGSLALVQITADGDWTLAPS
jgi:hypothetical protein